VIATSRWTSLAALLVLSPACGARSALSSDEAAGGGRPGVTAATGTSSGGGCAHSAVNVTVDHAEMTFASSCTWDDPPSPPLPVAFAQVLMGDSSTAGLTIQACASSSLSSAGILFATADGFTPGTYESGSYASNQPWDIMDGAPFSLTFATVGPVGGTVTGSFQYGAVRADFSVCRAPDGVASPSPPHP
jgi:hypothetical protein